MFEEPNLETRNHVFTRDGDGFTSRPATQEEIQSMREDSMKGDWMAIGRSCWECNSAHLHLIENPNINCFSCGRYYHRGVDITDYGDEPPKEGE